MLKARHQSPADLQNSRAVNWARPNFVRKQRRHSSLGARAKRPKTSSAACEIESNRGKRQRSTSKSSNCLWMLEIIEYRGYRLHVGPVGKGDSPTNLEKSRKDEIVAEAKRIIDERFASRS